MVKAKNDRITDAKFEVVKVGEPRTWGEREGQKWAALTWFERVVSAVIFVIAMTIVAWLANGLGDLIASPFR